MTGNRIKVSSINDHIWLLNDNNEATGYVIAGSERALIIDTMNGYEDVAAIAKSITALPLTVVNTPAAAPILPTLALPVTLNAVNVPTLVMFG